MSLQLPNYLYYTNEFAQAKLKEEVYIESPWGFSQKDGKNELKLNTSLYALKQAPKTFYKKLQGGFLERGLNKLTLNTWLFMKKDLICVVYVDDTIITGANEHEINSW